MIMGNRGGARKGAGRKSGTGISGIIRKHCEEFIVELLKNEAVRQKAIEDIQKKLFNDEDDYLYVIKNEGLYKIGYSSNLKKRYKQYETHIGDVELVFATRQNNCFDLESNLHKMYSDFRVRGEWFDLNEKQIEHIIRFCSERLIKSKEN